MVNNVTAACQPRKPNKSTRPKFQAKEQQQIYWRFPISEFLLVATWSLR
jgi:hypothetical protein